jgi:hypothetical protein
MHNCSVQFRQEIRIQPYPGADPGFQVRGGVLKKIGVFRVKIRDFTPKKQITESPSYP